MKRIGLFLLPVLLAVLVFALILFIFSRTNTAKGALQITSVPQSTVYINGKFIGKTPFCKCDPADMLAVGEYTIKLIPIEGNFDSYEEKITINPSVLTVVDRSFAESGKASGSIITLEKSQNVESSQLSVASFPFNADVSIDGNSAGITPVLLQNVSESDHEVLISKEGYASKTLRIHAVKGYTLRAVVTLGVDLLATPAAALLLSPTPSSSPSAAPAQVVILDTPTGFLRVRDTPSLGGTEIAQVHPGEVYPLVTDQSGWYQITLKDNKQGWVNAQYAKKQ